MFNRIRVLRPSLVVLVSSLLLLLFASMLMFIIPLRGSPSAFAASLQATWITCARAPRADHCNGQDPESQGCATDAVTDAHALIIVDGITVGRVERRFSKKCNSWWGRIFDFRHGAKDQLSISTTGYTHVGPAQFTNNLYRILYGVMEFNAMLSQKAPEVIGIFETNDQPIGPSATIPAIP